MLLYGSNEKKTQFTISILCVSIVCIFNIKYFSLLSKDGNSMVIYIKCTHKTFASMCIQKKILYENKKPFLDCSF